MLDHEGRILREGAVVLRSEAPWIWQRVARMPAGARLIPDLRRLTSLAQTLERAVALEPDERAAYLRGSLPETVLPQITLIAESFVDAIRSADGEERRVRQRLATILGDLHILVVRYGVGKASDQAETRPQGNAG